MRYEIMMKEILCRMRKIVPATAAVMAAAVLLAGCREERAGDGLAYDFSVYAFSAGAADAFLISTPGANVLIDCGEKNDGDDIGAYLEKRGITKLDKLIITHFDKDHIGGVPAVTKKVKIDEVLQSDEPKDSKTYARYMEALDQAGIRPKTLTEDKDISFELDGAKYEVDAPKGGYDDDESNNSSLIVSVTYGGKKLLFMGDAEDERIEEYLEDQNGPYDYLKVPHHGRSKETMQDLIDRVQPKTAVITSSLEEREDDDVVDILKRSGAEVFLTRKGPVMTVLEGGELETGYR